MKAELIERIDKRRSPKCHHPPMSEMVSYSDFPALYCIECHVMGSGMSGGLEGSFDPVTFAGWFVFAADEWLEYEPTGMVVYLRQKQFNGDTYVQTFAVTSSRVAALESEADIVVSAGIGGIQYIKGEDLSRGIMNRVFLITAAGTFLKAAQQCLMRSLYDSTNASITPKDS